MATITGTSGDDTLLGGGGDELRGLAGDDRLHGLDGDRMFGGAGDDWYTVQDGSAVFETEGGGYDMVTSWAPFTLPDHVEALILFPKEATLGVGNALDNFMFGGSYTEALKGLGGDDQLHTSTNSPGGGLPHDKLDGGRGNDQLFARGTTVLTGGKGADDFVVHGPSARDEHLITDFSAADRLIFNGLVQHTPYAVPTALVGGARDFTLSQTDDGVLVLYGKTEILLEGVLRGDLREAQFLLVQNGGEDNDRLNGGDHQDRLRGFDGKDRLAGGALNDELEGGSGADRLEGGSGADTFVFTALSDSSADAFDLIVDFNAADRDQIDISAIDADGATAADDAFAFVETFSAAAGEATLRYNAVKDRTVLRLDADGDGQADFVLAFSGEVTVEAGWVL